MCLQILTEYKFTGFHEILVVEFKIQDNGMNSQTLTNSSINYKT